MGTLQNPLRLNDSIYNFLSFRVMEYACEAHGHLEPALKSRLH